MSGPPDGSTRHYFDDDPTITSEPVIVDVTLPDTAFTMETDRGVFSHGHLDTATSMLIRASLPLAADGEPPRPRLWRRADRTHDGAPVPRGHSLGRRREPTGP